MRVFQHCCRWCSFVGLFVLCIGGCDHAPIQSQPAASPQPVAEPPATSEIASKPEVDQSRDKQLNRSPQHRRKQRPQHVPTGPVKIVNRKTGLALHGDGAKRIERAGAYWKIRLGESDKFLALADWATKPEYAAKPPEGRHQRFLHGIPDSENALMLWDFKPLGGGFWAITSRATGKCLESRNEKPVLWQSQFRQGAFEQQWRFETIADSGVEGDKKKSAQPSGETRPDAEHLPRHLFQRGLPLFYGVSVLSPCWPSLGGCSKSGDVGPLGWDRKRFCRCYCGHAAAPWRL